MRTYITFALIVFTLLSCGTTSVKSNASLIKTTDLHVAKINGNTALIEETTEGALTDKEGFQDIGSFKYSVFFDKDSKELFRIKNVEITDNTVTERYYFSPHELIYIHVSTSGQPDKAIYTNGFKVRSSSNVMDDEAKLLLNKAKRFQKAFRHRE